MRTFHDSIVLAQSSGHCASCHTPVARILVLDNTHRKWFSVHWSQRGNAWVEHQCPAGTKIDEPMKAAA